MTTSEASTGWTMRRGPRPERRRRTSVAGVSGGVGVTTVAAAIDAADRGVFVGRRVDVLVCRATGDSLVRAGRAAQQVTTSAGWKPVLAVNATEAAPPSRSVTARLRLIEPHASSVVLLPFVRRWCETSVPIDEIRGLLTVRRNELPRPLRDYARAAQDLRSALDSRSPGSAATIPARTSMPNRTLGRTR